MDRLKIGERLVQDGQITKEQLDQAMARQKELRESGVAEKESLIGMVMVKMGFIPEETLISYIFNKKQADQKSMEQEFREKL